jgi:hypothetical protein
MLSVTTQVSPAVTTNVSVVFFLPGTAPVMSTAPGVDVRLPRPPSPTLSTAQRAITDNLTLYLQDAANNDGTHVTNCPETGDTGGSVGTSYTFIPGQTSCDSYIVPQSKAHDRDRLYTLTSPPPGICSAAAQVLTEHGPCKLSGSTISTICTTAATEIAAIGCSCTTAAQTMITPPCRNTPNASECGPAIAALKACTF